MILVKLLWLEKSDTEKGGRQETPESENVGPSTCHGPGTPSASGTSGT